MLRLIVSIQSLSFKLLLLQSNYYQSMINTCIDVPASMFSTVYQTSNQLQSVYVNLKSEQYKGS